MIDKFDYWKYSETANCWDFVITFLAEQGVNLPRFGICPTDKRAMTHASKPIIENELVECEPMQNAIACHYQGRLLLHVGIVDSGKVRHAHHKIGVRRDSIKKFESMAQKTVYRIPKCLL